MKRIFKLEPMPSIGTTAAGQNVKLGGLSSLQFIKSEGSILHFLAMTDRGPNTDEVFMDNIEYRPFLLPNYGPRLLHFSIDSSVDSLTSDFQIISYKTFSDSCGQEILGLPPKGRSGSLENETAVDIFGKKISAVTIGIDSEGFCLFQNTYLVADEYGPSLMQFDINHKLINHWHAGSGLPQDLLRRKKNRGFEALASDDTYAYIMMQSPLASGTKLDENHARLIKFDPLSGKTVRQFYYPLTRTRADKIGDLVWLNNSEFYVIEQNAKLGNKGVREIHHIDLTKADSAGILQKAFIKDLNLESLEFMEKIEGICKVDLCTLAVVMDNDYGLEGSIDFSTGRAVFVPDAATYLALISI